MTPCIGKIWVLYLPSVFANILLKYLFLYWSSTSFFYSYFTVLNFYWQNHFTLKGFAGEATQLGFHPYIPQCDGLGNWEPTQCYESTGKLSLTKYSNLNNGKPVFL